MSNDPAAVVNRQFDVVVNGRNVDQAPEVFHPQLAIKRGGIQGSASFLASRSRPNVGGLFGDGRPPSDPIEGFKFAQNAIVAAFPDMRLDVVEQYSVADVVISRITFTGTHEGNFMGLEATHRRVEFDEVLFMKVTNDLISEVWALGDDFSFLQQLGVLDSPEP